MTISTTYMGDLSRVRVALSSAPAGADYAIVERSTDGITWTTVRGGNQVQLTAGAGHVDDYEFAAGVSNTYRARYVDSDLFPTFIAAGTAQTGNNTSLVPPHPAGLATGDLKLIAASIRNSGAGQVATPAGWTKVVEFANVAVLARRHQPGDVAPTVTFTGGVANADTLAQMIAIRNSKDSPVNTQTQVNPSTQNVDVPSNIQPGSSVAFLLGWKQDDLTSTAVPAFATKIADISSTAGDDASMFWDMWTIPASNVGLSFLPGNGTIAVTGGASAISRAMTFFLPVVDYLTQETGSITPTLTTVWLKNVLRPSLNLQVTVTDFSDIEEPARMGVFEIVGRSKPIGVTDVRSSQRFMLTVAVPTKAAELELKAKLALGSTVFLQAPAADSAIPTMYAVVDTTKRRRPTRSNRSQRRYFDLPLTEVAAPASTVASNTYVYDDVVADFLTYNDVVSGVASYSDLIDRVSDNEVVVP